MLPNRYEIKFTERALKDYERWVHKGDTKIIHRINQLIESLRVSPFEGIGRPEPITRRQTHYWSDRITYQDRMLYDVKENTVTIYQLRGHYDDH